MTNDEKEDEKWTISDTRKSEELIKAFKKENSFSLPIGLLTFGVVFLIVGKIPAIFAGIDAFFLFLIANGMWVTFWLVIQTILIYGGAGMIFLGIAIILGRMISIEK